MPAKGVIDLVHCQHQMVTMSVWGCLVCFASIGKNTKPTLMYMPTWRLLNLVGHHQIYLCQYCLNLV